MYKTKQPLTNYNTEAAIKCLLDIGYPIENIRQALPRLADLTQGQIADALSVTRQQVGHLISNRRRNCDGQAALAKAFNVPVDVLFPERLHCSSKAHQLAN